MLAQPAHIVLWRHTHVATNDGMAAIALPPFDPSDALVRHVAMDPRAMPVADITVASPVIEAIRASGGDVIVPLVSLGEVVDVLVLRSPATRMDAGTLAALEEVALDAASALRITELTRYRAEIARATARNVEELQIARAIQRSLLPESLPDVAGWHIDAHYQPAEVVGGDLYDFIPLPNDVLGIVLGDVTDKSVPAALMMAAARTLLRVTAQRMVLPGQVLARVNEDLSTQMPPGLFVTCFFAILDPATGRLRYANAGQSAPMVRTAEGVTELRARGWPLGMMPGARYDEAEITLGPGDTLLCFSDGLVETHAPGGTMYGTERVMASLSSAGNESPVLTAILDDHEGFAGAEWAQEDDLTILVLSRLPPADPDAISGNDDMELLADFTVPSDDGIERLAAERVLDAIANLPLTGKQRDRLATALAETVMNAAEHGNRHRPDLPVRVTVLSGNDSLVVRVFDQGRNSTIPEPVTPDLSSKLAGQQSSRGWGMFLIENMVDHVRRETTDTGHMVELTVRVSGSGDPALRPT